MKDVLVIIPTYNEIENIENIIISTFVLYPDINILIVDDNSPDFTFKKVQDLQTRFKGQFSLLKRSFPYLRNLKLFLLLKIASMVSCSHGS